MQRQYDRTEPQNVILLASTESWKPWLEDRYYLNGSQSAHFASTRIPAAQWASATLLIAIPGMVGEAVLLSHFSALMPKMHEASAGKYGAFLFSTYALVLTIAEIVTLRATR